MRTKRFQLWLLICLFFFPGGAFSQIAPDELADQLRGIGLTHGRGFRLLRSLVRAAPHRLAGSPGAEIAVRWAQETMTAIGLERVHLEPVIVPHWVRGAEEGAIVLSGEDEVPISVCALGGSVPTPDSGLTAAVVAVTSFQELHRLGARARGKIVLFNRPMDETMINTFSAYSDAVSQRTRGAIEAAKVGAVAALVRSVTTCKDDVPHTGMMVYDDTVAKVPAAAIGIQSAEELTRLLQEKEEVKVRLRLTCRSLPPVESGNVVGDLKGREKPEEIVLLGAHLDAWELGQGAHDDGAGCVHVLEALRLLKELNLHPRRTIRAVLFMNEEFGANGGRAYAASPKRAGETHFAAVESDRGGFLPLGFLARADSTRYAVIRSWLPYFQRNGLGWIRPGGGGADIGPLKTTGAMLLSLFVEDQTYFDVHHSANDVLESVHPRELELGCIHLALMAYLLAEM